jgi:glutamine amidotransferase
MLVVVDYGLGNMRSICGALDHLEVDYRCTSDHTVINSASGLIIPGVGSFPDGMSNLRNLGLVDVLDDLVLVRRIPVLGICLGFQLMAREGYEFGYESGLGWLNSKVVKLEPASNDIRIPHVGWNDCNLIKDTPLFSGIPAEALFYFTHSFHMQCLDESDVSAVSVHGQSFTAAIQKANIFGTQFHPEKSQLYGISLLRNFSNMANSKC